MGSLLVKNLKISFNTVNGLVNIVNDISFNINQGQIVGLVGESGSGKSVTSLAIMRLLENNALLQGQILLDGVDILRISEKEMQNYRGNKIAMIFQEPMTSLNPVITCGKQVNETIIRHQKISAKAAKIKTIALFNEVKIPDAELAFNKYPHQLSGGQKQRVMIAMALACNPNVLIADEPTTALDVTVQKNILELLLKLREERNMSILFISHDLGVIGEIADRILVMYKGNLVEEGNIETVFTKPKHPYTKGLLACRPMPQYQLKKLPTITDFVAFANNKMQATANTIENLRLQYAVNPADILQQRENLYQQKPILEIKNLNTWFPIKSGWFSRDQKFSKAVDGLNFDIYPGETFGLVGQSGCGKTTLSRTILKLIEPTSGEIIFDGANLSKLSPKLMRPHRKNIQIIFQDPYSSLNPSISIGKALIEPLQVHNLHKNDAERKNYVIDLMEKVGLNADYFNRYPHQFSGGQRQRIVIARALALQPKLIICDESVSALDVSVQAQVLNLLKELQQQFNLTYLFISHDMAVVKHIANRMMVMNKGKIEEIGFPDEIFNNPQKEYTKQLIAAIPKGKV